MKEMNYNKLKSAIFTDMENSRQMLRYRQVMDFFNNAGSLIKDEDEAVDFMITLLNILDNPNEYNASDYWGDEDDEDEFDDEDYDYRRPIDVSSIVDLKGYAHLGQGSYKKCYRAFDGWVIKFASEENNTLKEINLLAAAVEDCVERAFVPTYFIDIAPTLIEDSYSENYGYSSYDNDDLECDIFTTLILQPEVQTASDVGTAYHYEEAWEDMGFKDHFKKADGSFVTFAEFDKINGVIFDMNWTTSYLITHGWEEYTKLFEFRKRCGIFDLHDENIGYLTYKDKEYPVILDWLS